MKEVDPRCRLYGGDEETDVHLFIKCQVVQEVWRRACIVLTLDAWVKGVGSWLDLFYPVHAERENLGKYVMLS